MTEIALVLVIFGLLGLLGFQDYNNRKERKSLVNALKSKDATDYANLELADKTNIEVKKPKEEPIAIEDLDDDDFNKFVLENAKTK